MSRNDGSPAGALGRASVSAENLATYETDESVLEYGDETGLTALEAALVDEFFPPPPAPILDLGCGAGRTTIALANMGYRVVGVDMSTSLLAIARARFPDVTFLRMDACALSWRDFTFDGVLFSYNGIDCIYPASSRRQCLAEAHRVLTGGGTLLFSSHNYLGSLFSGGFFYLRGYRNALASLWAQIGNPFLAEWYLRYPRENQHLYSAIPDETLRQLADVGFEHRAMRGFGNESRRTEIKWHHQHVHFVAAKPR